MTTATKVYVIREINGTDYYSEASGWTPASDEATEYETREEADAAIEADCQDRDVKIFTRDVE